MTATIPTDAPTRVATAFHFLHRGDLDMARAYLSKLTDLERVEALMNAERLAVMLAQLSLPTAEDMAAADALPDSVEGFPIAGLTRNQQHAERALRPDCPYCGCLHTGALRDEHERLDAGNEATWMRRARS